MLRYVLLAAIGAAFLAGSTGCERPKQLPLKMRDALNAGKNSYTPGSITLQSKPYPKKKEPVPPDDEWKVPGDDGTPGSVPLPETSP